VLGQLLKKAYLGDLMKIRIRFIAFGAGLLVAQLALGQAAPPAGSTGLCKDGTYTTAASKSGACRGHQGVKTWLAASAAPAAASPKAAAAPAVAPAPAAAPAPKAVASTPAAAPAKGSPAAKAAARPQAAGGGPGLVWVNTSSNVYHCYGSDFYGKTKAGAYMTEADAKAKGAHGDHGKTCSK
jgi:pyruvate/2-oxoglutarate dehydrogenase complex dihydrolipoamide acyltransferase (E2) component